MNHVAPPERHIAEALAATGYRSRSHFARHFEARFGVTPAAVRRRRH